MINSFKAKGFSTLLFIALIIALIPKISFSEQEAAKYLITAKVVKVYPQFRVEEPWRWDFSRYNYQDLDLAGKHEEFLKALSKILNTRDFKFRFEIEHSVNFTAALNQEVVEVIKDEKTKIVRKHVVKLALPEKPDEKEKGFLDLYLYMELIKPTPEEVQKYGDAWKELPKSAETEIRTTLSPDGKTYLAGATVRTARSGSSPPVHSASLILINVSKLGAMVRETPGPVAEAADTQERVKKLIQKLKSDDGKERVEATKKLIEIGEPAVEPLIKALREGEGEAAGILGQIGDERAIEPLIEAMKNPDLGWSAAKALGMIGKPAEKPIFAALREMEKDEWVWPAEALAKIKGVDLTPLIDMLSDESTKVRLNAAGAFFVLAAWGVKDSRAVPPLIPLLKDQDSDIKIVASMALCAIRDPRSREALIDALQDKNPGVRYFAAGGLAYIGGRPEIDVLKKIAQDDPASSVRLCAKLAIREIEARLTGKKVIYSIPISHSDFNRIKVGMSKEEVREILGEPLEKTERAWHYTLPRPGEIHPTIIRIDFDQDGKVTGKMWD